MRQNKALTTLLSVYVMALKIFNKARALSAELDKRQTINNAKSMLNVWSSMERIAGSPYSLTPNRTSMLKPRYFSS